MDPLDNLPTLYEPPRERQRRFPFVTTLSERCTARERRRRKHKALFVGGGEIGSERAQCVL